jgi:hypothetical protein
MLLAGMPPALLGGNMSKTFWLLLSLLVVLCMVVHKPANPMAVAKVLAAWAGVAGLAWFLRDYLPSWLK